MEHINTNFVKSLVESGKITSDPYILQIGEIIEWKRPLDLAFASNLLPKNIQVLFVGDGDKELIKKITRLSKKCICLGPVYGSDRNGLIVNSKLVCVSSLREPFGLTLLEAGTLGVPSIVRPSGSLPEIIIDGYNGFIAKNLSIKAYSNAINLGLSNKTKLTDKLLSEYTIDTFSPKNTTYKMVDLANQILANNNKPE